MKQPIQPHCDHTIPLFIRLLDGCWFLDLTVGGVNSQGGCTIDTETANKPDSISTITCHSDLPIFASGSIRECTYI